MQFVKLRFLFSVTSEQSCLIEKRDFVKVITNLEFKIEVHTTLIMVTINRSITALYTLQNG